MEGRVDGRTGLIIDGCHFRSHYAGVIGNGKLVMISLVKRGNRAPAFRLLRDGP